MKAGNHASGLIDEITARTHQDPALCYQCGKCSAGCPVRQFMDVPPNRVIRYVQMGMFEKALRSSTIWLCASCLTCTTRCPKSFDLAGFMDALREIALQKKIIPVNSNTIRFHRAFITQIKRYGRLYEMGLIRDYKLASMRLFQDLDVAPIMFMKGKIGIFPHRVRNREAIRKLFHNALALEEQKP